MAGPPPRRLRADQAERLVRRLAKDSANVILTTHAKQRMAQRGILRRDLDRILRTGFVTEEPRRNEYGEWQCKVVHRLAGTRDAGAVTVIASEGKLIIRTVEREDRR